MSLINDALKRARQHHKKDTTAPASGTPLEPVENTPARRTRSWPVLAASVIIAGVALWFLMKWWSATPPSPQIVAVPAATNKSIASKMIGALSAASNVVRAVTNLRSEASAVFDGAKTSVPPATAVAASTVAPESGKAPSASKTPAPSPATVEPPVPPPASRSSNAVAAAVSDTSAQPASSPPAARNPAFNHLKLQGIFYRLSKPSALINNRTLFVGDEIEGARVVAINRSSVKVEMRGQTGDLTLK